MSVWFEGKTGAHGVNPPSKYIAEMQRKTMRICVRSSSSHVSRDNRQKSMSAYEHVIVCKSANVLQEEEEENTDQLCLVRWKKKRKKRIRIEMNENEVLIPKKLFAQVKEKTKWRIHLLMTIHIDIVTTTHGICATKKKNTNNKMQTQTRNNKILYRKERIKSNWRERNKTAFKNCSIDSYFVLKIIQNKNKAK